MYNTTECTLGVFLVPNFVRRFREYIGLTKAEEAEQKKLRKAYLAAIRKNLRGSLNRIDIQNKDGSIENLGEKYGKKLDKN